MANSDFLLVKPGDIVVVEEDALLAVSTRDWWVGCVIYIVRGARNPSTNSLFQIVDLDTGIIETVNADLIKRILRPL